MEKDAVKRLYLQPQIRLLNPAALRPGGTMTRGGADILARRLSGVLERSTVVRNYSAQELYRSAHRKGLNCRATSYSGCPQGHLRPQGALHKLVRNVLAPSVGTAVGEFLQKKQQQQRRHQQFPSHAVVATAAAAAAAVGRHR